MSTQTSPLDRLYEGREHGKWYKIHQYKAEGSDGIDVELWECRLPARFYSIRFGKHQLNTGSGEYDFAKAVCERLASGMLGLDDAGAQEAVT